MSERDDEQNHPRLDAQRAPDDAPERLPVEDPEDPFEGAVPPGYDWPTHGGYLGCLFGVVFAAVLGAFLATTALSVFWAAHALAGWLYALLALVIVLACVVAFGRLGWLLGKRFFRQYPQSRPTWGENDEGESRSAHAAGRSV